MSSFISGTPITFNGEEARKGIILPAFQKPLLSKTMQVVEDIKAKKQIAFVGRITKVMKAAQACGATQNTTNKAVIPISQKFWLPVGAEMNIEQCATDLAQTFYVWGLAKGYERNDLTKAMAGDDPQDFIGEFVMDLASDAMYEDIMRMIWFNDTTITNVDDSPAGTLTLANDIPYYNLFDGLWKQIFTSVAALTTPRYTITANAGVSYAAQALADGASYTILRNLVDQADARLADQPDQVILVSKSIFDNWVGYRESKALESSHKDQEMGISVAEFRGIPMIPINLWDRYIKSDFDNGTTYYLPHRAVYTHVSNLQAGFDASPENMNNVIEFWYERYQKKTVMRGNLMIDAKTAIDELISVAY